MINLIVYGSLLDPQEWSSLELRSIEVAAVMVKGYRRTFNQEPSWRRRESRERAVLNVEQDSESCFNAIMFQGISIAELEKLDQRERGYNREAVDSSLVTSFHQRDSHLSASHTFVYQGKPEKRNETLLPNGAYLETCLRGSQHWGRDFHTSFLLSTYIAGRNVHEFLVRDYVDEL